MVARIVALFGSTTLALSGFTGCQLAGPGNHETGTAVISILSDPGLAEQYAIRISPVKNDRVGPSVVNLQLQAGTRDPVGRSINLPVGTYWVEADALQGTTVIGSGSRFGTVTPQHTRQNPADFSVAVVIRPNAIDRGFAGLNIIADPPIDMTAALASTWQPAPGDTVEYSIAFDSPRASANLNVDWEASAPLVSLSAPVTEVSSTALGKQGTSKLSAQFGTPMVEGEQVRITAWAYDDIGVASRADFTVTFNQDPGTGTFLGDTLVEVIEGLTYSAFVKPKPGDVRLDLDGDGDDDLVIRRVGEGGKDGRLMVDQNNDGMQGGDDYDRTFADSTVTAAGDGNGGADITVTNNQTGATTSLKANPIRDGSGTIVGWQVR
jgi:hypothetical protein